MAVPASGDVAVIINFTGLIAPGRMRQAVVASPGYFTRNPKPRTPQDLVGHQCINLWLSQSQGHYIWEFSKGGREPKVRVNGPLAFNHIAMMRNAALDGLGLVNLPQDYITPYLADGRLVRASWRIGARRSPAIISTILAAGNPRPLSRC